MPTPRRDPIAWPIAWPVDRPSPDIGWTPPGDPIIISSDDHLMEPPGLWEDRLPTSMRDKAPKLWRDDTGFHLEVEGRSFDTPGLNSLMVEGRPGMTDQARRMVDMDAEGVDIGFVFPQKALGIMGMEDKEVMYACIDVYNEYLAEWCQYDPDRLFGIAILPTIFDPERTADYIDKIKAWGFKAMEIPSSPRDVEYNRSRMEPMWDAIEASGIPLSFHIGEFPNWRGAGALGTYLTSNFEPFRKLWALLTFSGVLERHPELKVIFTEGGISWVASALYDADRTYREFASEMRPQLAELPSYYWWRQCYATFMSDPAGLRLMDMIGHDHVMWSFDYPHPESTLGESRRIVRDIYDQLGDEQAEWVVSKTAETVWGIEDAVGRNRQRKSAMQAGVAAGD